MPLPVRYSAGLRAEYEELFHRCTFRPDRIPEIQRAADAVAANRRRYEALNLGVPWYFTGAIHHAESGLDFGTHLHNGDPLEARTVHAPAGRPAGGAPPFTWEASARDALRLKRLHRLTDWSLGRTLFELERYNGFGYRMYHPHVKSPYLWSFSTLYGRGKYTADGKWSGAAVSKQCGTAVILRRLLDQGIIRFSGMRSAETAVANRSAVQPLVVKFACRRPGDRKVLTAARLLQEWLNTHDGISIAVDGWPGPETAEAWRRVSGHPLPGAPPSPE